MKTLENLTNTEKARLLHDLFPDEIRLFLEDLTNVCSDIENNKDEHSKKWNIGWLTFNYWLSLANETAGILKSHKFNMIKSSRVFSDQLFFTYTSLFVNDRIVKYAEHKSQNEKFKIAVNLLYHP